MAGYRDMNLLHRGIQARIGSFINLIVHIKKIEQRRFVSEVVRVSGFDLDIERYRTKHLYRHETGLSVAVS
jgi:Flp pilus assembly CpaF family ATPase